MTETETTQYQLVTHTIILCRTDDRQLWQIAEWWNGSASVLKKGRLSSLWPEARMLAFRSGARKDLIETNKTLRILLEDPYDVQTIICPSGLPESAKWVELEMKTKSGDPQFSRYVGEGALGQDLHFDLNLVDAKIPPYRIGEIAFFADARAIDMSTSFAEMVKARQDTAARYLAHGAAMAEARSGVLPRRKGRAFS
ncbi:hypothetical protein [Labrys sp. ZIDIC5]|uniref:hypothetical protein n=1 Tax=Labrys sedimenti TaxID=3106036 RepID=UPI002ACA5DA2|nr:hypothetical protein [Labrys sp. ZIDIC5]MDZ5448620.1 hypothetical protein [Labrys sp. ZIDIC5]